MASTLFTDIGTEIETTLNAFYSAAAGNLAGEIGVLAIAGVTMFISIYGALVIAGKIQQPFQDFAIKAVKIIIVAAVALNAGNYMNWVVGAVQGLENGMVSAMNTTGGTPGNIYESLDEAIDKTNDLIEQMNKEGSDLGITQIGRAISIALCICVVGFGAILFLFFAGAVTILTKFMLALLFAVGPIFVLALMWPATAAFFDRWLSQCLSAVLTIVFLAVLLNMGLDIFMRLVDGASATMTDPDGGNYFAVAFSLFGCCLIFAYLCTQIPSVASAIGGGVGLASISLRQAIAPAAAIGNLAGQPIAGAGRAVGWLRQSDTRLDHKSPTGLQTTSPRYEHLAMGRTVMNSQYRSALKERMRSSWGKNSVSKD